MNLKKIENFKGDVKKLIVKYYKEFSKATERTL